MKCDGCGGDGTEHKAYRLTLPFLDINHQKRKGVAILKDYFLCEDCVVLMALNLKMSGVIKRMEDRRKGRDKI